MMDRSANLHLYRMTIRQAAKSMNVSERSVKKAIELLKSGRSDLIAAVEAGSVSLHRALKLAKPEKYDKPRDGLKALVLAWHKANEVERHLFLDRVTNGER
jgi:hypothetical protein